MELIGELWSSMAITGKSVVLILVGLSIYSYGVMVDRGLALRWTRAHSSRFAVAAAEGGLAADALFSRASAAEEQGYCSLATVVGAGLTEYQLLREEDQAAAVVLEGVDEATSRALDVAIINLRSRLSGMATIAGVAPFLGLFGTVTGLISAFRGIAATGSGGLATVSGGISEALVTTVIGLFVAIPALWAYNFFMNRIDVMGVELDNSASRLVMHAVRRSLREDH
ncbi:MAG TPA: flagellar motor protein MotA [Candidatus Handelsmanbacteria bacterium]|nr:flagellar motor protein MotA [Candidatus Handelsmanbacteria bacterium]